MKNNLKIISVALIVGLLFSSCGGGGGGGSSAPASETSTDDKQSSTKDNDTNTNDSNTKSTVVKGGVYDGPIYGATVSIYKKDGTLLGSTNTLGEDGKIGNYSIEIENLPDEYIVKTRGGKDTGSDGIINQNDEEGFEMSSVGLKENPITHITPATSLIANMVEDGVDLTAAKSSVKKSLGLPDGIDLTSTNPKTNDIANRAAIFVAQVLKSIPTNNKKEALKAITKEFKNKSDDDTSVVTITSRGINIDNLDLSLIASHVKISKPDEIIQVDIDKLKKSKDLLSKKIRETVRKTKPVNKQTSKEQKEAIASHKALEKLLEHIRKKDIETIDLNKLESLVIKYEKGFNLIVQKSIDDLTNTNIDIVTDVIETNLDKDISSIIVNLKNIASHTKDLDKNSVDIYKKLYSIIDIEDSGKISNLDKNSIKDMVSSIEDTDANIKESLSSLIASRLASIVQESTSTIDISKIAEVKSATIDNIVLKDKLKSLTKKEKSSSKAEQKSAKLALETIQKNFENKDFEFDNVADETVKELEKTTRAKLQTLLDDDTKSIEEIFDEIKAIEMSTKLVKLNVEFDENKFDKNLNIIKTLTSTLRTQKTNNKNIDLTTSLKKIAKKLEQASKDNSSIAETSKKISDNINDYIQDKEKIKIYITTIRFPVIGNIRIPSLNEIYIK